MDTARFIPNAAQKIVWSSKQESFGKMQVNEDPDANGVSVIFNHRFPGQYFDAETGLHQNYFRDYDPSIGRYIESDPLGLRAVSTHIVMHYKILLIIMILMEDRL